MTKKYYIVESDKGGWRGSYDSSYAKPNQPSPLAMAVINAKGYGGKVFEIEGNSRIQVWPRLSPQ